MKALRIVILIAGIALLTTGFWVQDFSPASSAVDKFWYTAHWSGPPDLGPLFSHFHTSAQLGLLLKLTGAGILFLLFFWKLYQVSARKNMSVTLPAIAGLGSAICFAIFTVLAPAARYVEWTFQILACRVPYDLGAEASQQLQNAIINRGFSTPTGALLLAASLLLLVAALMALRRDMLRVVSIPTAVPAVLLIAQRQAIHPEEPSILETMLGGGIFAIVAFIFSIVIAMIFVWALLIRKTNPRKTSLLTIVLVAAGGCLPLAFYLLSMANISGLRAVLNFYEGAPSPADMAKGMNVAFCSTYFLSIALLVSAIVFPILYALSFQRPTEEVGETEEKNRSSLPLTALVSTIAVFAAAGLFGLRGNPYKTSLRKVALAIPYGSLEKVKDDVARLDSEEGMVFLLKTLHNPREFFWHYPIMEYLLKYSHTPKAKELFFRMFSDTSYPIPSAHAASVITRGLWDRQTRNETQKALLFHLSRQPGHGARILEIALRCRNLRSAFIFDIMKTCAKTGMDKFVFPKGRTRRSEWDEILELPDGFTIQYRQKLGADTSRFLVQLFWCKPMTLERTTDLHMAHTALVANGKRFDYVTNEFGEELPDYLTLRERIRKASNASRTDSAGFWVELRVDSLVPAHQITYILEACARAGVMEVSIREP